MEPSPLRFKPLYSQLTQGYLPAIVNGAQQAGIFEALEKEGASTVTLAEKLHKDPGILGATLEVLTAIKLLIRDEDYQYHLSRSAKHFLLESSPAAQIRDIRSFCMQPGPFDDLTGRLKNSTQHFDSAAFSEKEALIELEQRARGGQIQEVVNFICAIPQFESFTLMCDLAGSSGYYSQALLNKNPNLRARVYDTPAVAALAGQMGGDRGTCGRLEFLGIDLDTCSDFGRGYDLFFVSHFLYHWAAQDLLPRFFKKVNRAMRPGGIFVSNHIGNTITKDQDHITQSIIELLARVQGYPTLTLDESKLKQALSLAGFSEFRTRPAKDGTHLNNTLVSAQKIKEI
nr:methyltransferase [uncultured Desulfobacter sp.]